MSLIHGTDFNRKSATEDDLRACCAAYQALRDPELGVGGPEAVERFLLRVAGQQLVFQQSAFFNDLARSVALFEQTTPRRALPVLDSVAQPLLGEASEYIGAAFVLHTGALKNLGTFDLEWLTQPQFADVTARYPRTSCARPSKTITWRRRINCASCNVMLRGRRCPSPPVPAFGFNPLASRPACELASTLLIPVPAFVFRQASPLGLCYAGLAR